MKQLSHRAQVKSFLVLLFFIVNIFACNNNRVHREGMVPSTIGESPSPPTGQGGEKEKGRLAFGFAGELTDGIPSPWRLVVSAGRPTIRVFPDREAGTSLYLDSESASFFLADHSKPFRLGDHRYLTWSWKAIQLPKRGDVRVNSLLFGENRNDQAVQLLVLFEGKRMLSYVWDTTAPVGTKVKEPNPFATVMTTVVDSGTQYLGVWRSHKRDLIDDYRSRFGGDPPQVVGVLVQSNSNHTSSSAEAAIGEIRVTKE